MNEEVSEQIKVRSKVIGSILIDGLFLFAWFILVHLIHYYLEPLPIRYEVSEMDKLYIQVCEYLFSFFTFLSVISFLVIDLFFLFMKTKCEILEISKKF